MATTPKGEKFIHAQMKEHISKRYERSDVWDKLRLNHYKAHPTCAACGSKKFVQVHHIVPFQVEPSGELDPKNLITLCVDTNNCHLMIGHGGEVESYNPNVVADAAAALAKPTDLATIQAKAAAAKLALPPITE